MAEMDLTSKKASFCPTPKNVWWHFPSPAAILQFITNSKKYCKFLTRKISTTVSKKFRMRNLWFKRKFKIKISKPAENLLLIWMIGLSPSAPVSKFIFSLWTEIRKKMKKVTSVRSSFIRLIKKSMRSS